MKAPLRALSAKNFEYILIILIIMFFWAIGGLSVEHVLIILIPGITWALMTSRSRRNITQSEVVVITGCDSGLGYSLALHCHAKLTAKTIAAVHDVNSLGAQELYKNGITVQQLDITDSQSIRNFVGFIQMYLKQNDLKLRAFINNAGVMIFGEFEWTTTAQIRKQIEVNLLGTMNLTKAIIPLLRAYKSRLIIVTSHCAKEPLPGVATYAATKAGLLAWATALRMELKKFGISVVNFIPGSFVTDSNILSRQMEDFHSMESEMSQEAAATYGEYFRTYANYLKPLARSNSLKRINNVMLYEKFESALAEEPARASYKCEPLRYTFYHSLMRIAPTRIHDFLVERFIKMPAWKSPKTSSIATST